MAKKTAPQTISCYLVLVKDAQAAPNDPPANYKIFPISPMLTREEAEEVLYGAHLWLLDNLIDGQRALIQFGDYRDGQVYNMTTINLVTYQEVEEGISGHLVFS